MQKIHMIVLIGAVLSWALSLTLRRLALKFRFLLKNDIALVGGISIGISFLVSIILGLSILGLEIGPIGSILAISMLVLVIGFIDDLREATVAQKFILQSLCAALLIGIDIRTHIVFLDDWGNILVTMLWILGITNAFNLLDIMDGLSAGVAWIASMALFILSCLEHDPVIGLLSGSLLAAITGFWVFNRPPAIMYLGNSGSHFLGFVLAALTLMMKYARIETPLALISPILILWVALLESAFLIFFRMQKGIVPFQKSDDHIAFRLLATGMSKQKVLTILLSLSAVFAVCGIIITLVRNSVGAVIIIFVTGVSYALFCLLRRLESNAK